MVMESATSAAGGSLLCSSVFAESPQKQLISWPVSVPSMNAKPFEYLFDGQLGKLLEITGPGIHLTSTIPNFTIRPWESPLHHSLGFMNPQAMDLRISITLMKDEDWLPSDFGDEDVKAYLAWFQQMDPDYLFSPLNEGSGYPPEAGSPRILDQQYHILKLRKTSTLNQQSIDICHAIVPYQQGKLVITLECPSTLMGANYPNFLSYLYSIQKYSASYEKI